MKIIIIGNSRVNDHLSGSDRITMECAKHWFKKGHKIQLFTCEDNYKIFQRYNLGNITYFIVPTHFKKFIFLLYSYRTIKGSLMVLKLPLDAEDTVIYSSSDFWPDSITGWILKMRLKKAKWIAGFYLFAPNLFNKGSPYRGKTFLRFLNGVMYYVSQLPVYWIVRLYADVVFVTNELDRWRFIDGRKHTSDKVIAVRGGVDVKTPLLVPEPKMKKFEAVFIGRLHPQKGVLELVDIWRIVCRRKKDAKIAIIGVGELEREVKVKIRKYGLDNNFVFFGLKDGIEKLKIFKDSKIVVHPSIYESGGMAAGEAMACGLPGVSFDVPALKTYYPKGMLKTPCFDLEKFAENIFRLLEDKNLYKKIQDDAMNWSQEWAWDKRAEELLKNMIEMFNNKTQ